MIAPCVTAVLVFLLLFVAARKWELKLRHYLPWSLGVSALSGGLTFVLSRNLPDVPVLIWIATMLVTALCSSICAIMYFFFRDPERHPPERDDQIVSPADGTIVYVKEIEDGRFPFAVKNSHTIPLSEFSQVDLIPGKGLQIGIAMNYLNVHVNRSPIRGVVKMVQAIPGKFASLKHLQSLLENERALMVFENEELKVGIVQIASRLVRRIVPFVQEEQNLAQGDRVGMIKFGSQVDLLIPYREDLQICAQIGQEVTAGETVLVQLGSQEQAGP